MSDHDGAPMGEHWAVVYAPQRHRGRFPANCVQLCDGETTARAQADNAHHLHAARLAGPSKSSEGLMIYYLVRWLE